MKRNKFRIVEYFDKGRIRTVMREDKPWFVLRDVCDILGLISVSKTAERLLEAADRSKDLIDTPGGKQMLVTVNEPGLYDVILASHKPVAKGFRNWLTHEMLPFLIETGTYTLEDSDWMTLRRISKAMYNTQCDVITDTARDFEIDRQSETRLLRDEADFINVLVFNCSARKWRKQNPKLAKKGLNQRDFATTNELLLVTMMEMINFTLIHLRYDPEARAKILIDVIPTCRSLIEEDEGMKRIIKGQSIFGKEGK